MIASPTSEDTSIGFTQSGVYTYRLTVDDGGLSGFDEAVVTGDPDPVSNAAPSVDVGLDRTTTVSVGVSLDAVVSSESDSTVIDFIENPDAEIPSDAIEEADLREQIDDVLAGKRPADVAKEKEALERERAKKKA